MRGGRRCVGSIVAKAKMPNGEAKTKMPNGEAKSRSRFYKLMGCTKGENGRSDRLTQI